MVMNCETCRFWKLIGQRESGHYSVGKCRRHAPRPMEQGEPRDQGAWWPDTDSDDWCGEWQPIESPILSESVRALSFSPSQRVRIWKMCMRLNINTVGELVAKSEDELLEAKNFGFAGIVALRGALAHHNLKLRG